MSPRMKPVRRIVTVDDHAFEWHTSTPLFVP
jgi:hypothetical protein